MPPEIALANDVFDQFCGAAAMKTILAHYRHLCELLSIKPTNFPLFYPKLKSKLKSWKAQALWNKFDKRASHKCYNRGKACSNNRVLIIGAGPCGLRAAIEAQLLGAKVVVIEKRDRFSRNNVLHLWPFVIHDLKSLGAKKFFGKFCAGSIDHISIRQLQCILMKVALILGVEIHEGVGFESVLPPPSSQDEEKIGWRALTSPPDHPVSQYEFDVLIGADGKRNTLEGFKRKEFRGKLAIAITANFINKKSEAEARVEEISGVAFIFNQKFFKDLYYETGIDLENIVYYKDDTHYFVMTAKKQSLLDKGVILNDFADTAKLLALENINKEGLKEYARQAADFSTNYQLPHLEFAVNHYGQSDVAMFDFTSMYAAENACRFVERNGHKLLMTLVGDSLLEPFWPTGSGCARGFLSSMDACWAIRSWASGNFNPIEVLAERESIYRILGQTTPENLHRDHAAYTLDPTSRYPNLNIRSVLPVQVKGLYDTDDQAVLEMYLKAPVNVLSDTPKKRRRRESQVHPDILLFWLKQQVTLYDTVHITDLTSSFKDGLALCAIIHRYRPDLIDFHSLKPDETVQNNQRAFDILEKELGIAPIMTGAEMEEIDLPDQMLMVSYLSQIYEAFRREIPHIQHPRLAEEEIIAAEPENMLEKVKNLARLTSEQRASLLQRLASESGGASRGTPSSTTTRKRHSSGVLGSGDKRCAFSPLENTLSTSSGGRKTRKRRSGALPGTVEREVRAHQIKTGGLEEDISGRVKNLEEKFRGGTSPSMKPKDLYRAIGKIEKTDWNVKEIEKKIEENKYGKCSKTHSERVPKWSREQFADKFSAVERKLRKKGFDEAAASKYAEIDQGLKKLERKIKEGSVLEQGQRGSNKVSAMAAQLATMNQEPEKHIQKTGSKPALPSQSGSELCHFCNKRVYLMERMNAEGRHFHRGCFRCEYCSINLRLGNYAFDREGKFGNRFFCTQHFGLPGTMKMRARRKNEDIRTPHRISTSNVDTTKSPAQVPPVIPKTPEMVKISELEHHERDGTPERIEIEVDGDNEPGTEAPSEMDEDEWTDRNFGASCAENNSDENSSDESSDEDNEEYSEALDVPLNADETLRLAEDWTRKYAKSNGGGEEEDEGSVTGSETEENGSDEEDDEPFSYQEYDSEDDESTATEGEEEIKAREMRKQEVRLQVPDRVVATDSDTEVGTEYTSTESESEEEEENSATEISTDSEFERDETTPKHEVPDIVISETLQTKQTIEPPHKIFLNGKLSRQLQQQPPPPIVEPQVPLKPLVSSDFKVPFTRPSPLMNPNKGDYNLNKTQSTEGIASKLSLELKKKYLLGSQWGGAPVQKSGSTSILDTKFKSCVNQISEAQKLLNPAPEPSVTMQAFLQGADKFKAPTIVSAPAVVSPVIVPAIRKELDNVDKFQHVCSLAENVATPLENIASVKVTTDEDVERPRSPAHETSIIVPDVDLKKSVFNEKTNNWEAIERKSHSSEFNSEDEMDVDSEKLAEAEVHDADNKDDGSDTLSSNDVSTLSSFDENGGKAQNLKIPMSPPKVEIHNSKGELLVEENCPPTEVVDLVQSNLIKNVTDRMNTSMPDVCLVSKATPPANEPSRNQFILEEKNAATSVTNLDEKIGSKSVENLSSNSFNAKIISVPAADESSGSVLKQVNNPSELFATNALKATGRDSPPSPVSESLTTGGAFTETELSDWAREEEPMSEFLDDSVFKHLSTKNITYRRHQKPKTSKKALNLRGVAAKIAKTEDFDEYQHVCGKESPSTPRSEKIEFKEPYPLAASSSLVLTNVGDIEFMDTGNEDSSTEEAEGVNNILVQNKGYVQFVNTNTDDEYSELSTPLAEITPEVNTSQLSVPYKPLESNVNDDDESSHVTTTTTSDLVTIKTNPTMNSIELIGVLPFEAKNEAVINSHPCQLDFIEKRDVDTTSKAYQDYVQRFQGRISPFSNARDSIDIRKSRKHSKSSLSTDLSAKDEIIKEDEKENLPSPVVPNGIKNGKPSTSKKLEELSRERTKQKDLIHEMVMNKLIAEGKSPTDRKSKRSSRGSFSPLGIIGAHNALHSPYFNSNDHLKNCPNNLNHASYEQMKNEQNDNIESTLSNEDLTPTNDTRKDIGTQIINGHTPTGTQLTNGHGSSPNNKMISSSPNKSLPPDQIVTPKNQKRRSIEFKPPLSLDLYHTPMNSLKQVRARPVSVHSSFKTPSSMYGTPSSAYKSLPSTPCYPSDTYSLPDIPKAIDLDDVFQTPVRPPRAKQQDFQELRNSAKARAKLLSDTQLGLSPEEKLKLLKQKIAQRRLVCSETDSYPGRPTLSSSDKLTRHTSSVTSPLAQSSTNQTPTTASSHKTDSLSTVEPVVLTSPSSSVRKKCKDRERRKSLIQAVSEFFHKKSPSPCSSHPPLNSASTSTPNTTTTTPTTTNTGSSSKFKFPRIHHKHKSKDKTPPPFCDHIIKPSLSESEIRRQMLDGLVAPPIPPPPLNYKPTHLKLPSDESLTDMDDFNAHLEDSITCNEDVTATSASNSTLSKKQSRSYRRMARQAQHKRLRMAQEIQRQLEELEVKQRELEARGVEVEKMVRGEGTDSLCSDESNLLQQWYDLLRERSELGRLERELSLRAQEIDLEERHARLQFELKERMEKEHKTEEDVAIEGRIIKEMLDIVQQRHNLVSLEESDRQRYKEEDKDLEAQILALKQH